MNSTQLKNIGRSLLAGGTAALGIPLLQNQFGAINLIPSDWMRWFILFGLVCMVIGPMITMIGTKEE